MAATRVYPTYETCVRRHDVGCCTCPSRIKKMCLEGYDRRSANRGRALAWEQFQREQFQCLCGATVSWTPRDPEDGPAHMVGLVACANGHPWRILSDGTIEPSPEHAYR